MTRAEAEKFLARVATAPSVTDLQALNGQLHDYGKGICGNAGKSRCRRHARQSAAVAITQRASELIDQRGRETISGLRALRNAPPALPTPSRVNWIAVALIAGAALYAIYG